MRAANARSAAVAEVIFDRTFDKWSFARATTTWSGPCAHDDDPVAAALAPLAAAAWLASALPAPAQSLKPWRQALIIPKADAGFFLMAAKRGFLEREGLKVELLEVKDDPSA